MNVLANVLIGISLLITYAIFNALYLRGAPKGGDAVVSYVWGLIFLYLAFFACMALISLYIGWKGGFAWITPAKGKQFLVVGVFLLAAAMTSALSALYREEAGPVPAYLRFLSGFVPVLVPLVLVLAAALLANESLRSNVSTGWYAVPLALVFALSVSGVAVALFGWMQESVRNQERRLERLSEEDRENQARMLQEIDSCDLSKDLIMILVFTDANQSEAVRTRALERIRSYPDWQQELVRRLGTDWAPEVFTFLASNPVDDPALFADAIREGVLIQARLIRESIRNANHPSNFYAEQFTWEVERVLRTVDRFHGNGVDYIPAVRELRAALDEPSEYEKPKFRCIALLDNWLKSH